MLIKPQIGDKRLRSPCPYCSSPRYEIYEGHPAYHNDIDYRWTSDGHGDWSMDGVSFGPCISYQKKLIKNLIKRCEPRSNKS